MFKKFFCIIFSFIIGCISCLIPCTAFAFNEHEIPSVPDGYDVSWFNEEKAIEYIKYRFLHPSSGTPVDIDEEYNQYYTFGYSFYKSQPDCVMIVAYFYNTLPEFSYSSPSIRPNSNCYKGISGFFCQSDNEFGIEFKSNANSSYFYHVTNDNKVHLYNYNYTNDDWYGRTNFDRDTFYSLGFVFADNIIFGNGSTSGSNSVDVKFTPAFDLNMNEQLYSDRLAFGGSSTGSHFELSVKNNLKKPIQIRMYITGVGEKFNLGEVSAGPTHTGFANRNWNVSFIYMSKDWVIAPDISTGDTSKNRVQYKPTAWHYCADNLTQLFAWSSINVVEQKEYDIVVEYVECSDSDYANTTVDDANIVECFRQTFSIYKRAVPYDMNSEEFGVMNIHGYDDYLTAENSAEGYIDDKGKTQIKDSFNVNSNLYGNGSSGSHQLYSGGNFSLSSLQSSTANVLSFFRYVFNFFPSQAWNAFYFVIVVCVIFAFIKLLKG